jgi:hypothetical protein
VSEAVSVLIVLAGALFLLAMVRRWPRVLLVVAALLSLLPFAVPLPHTIFRFGLFIIVWAVFLKVVQYVTRDERPPGAVDFVQFLTVLAVADWQAPRRSNRGRAARVAATGLLQIGTLGAAFVLLPGLAIRGTVITVVSTELLLYLALAGMTNVVASLLDLRGVPYRRPFDSPLLARSVAEFWGRRWNSWARHIFHRFVFLPMGGRRRPWLGTMSAFVASGLLHEALVAAATLQAGGWMLAFFTLQGLAVITSSAVPGRRMARRAPVVSWALTITFLLASGSMFVAGMLPVLR